MKLTLNLREIVQFQATCNTITENLNYVPKIIIICIFQVSFIKKSKGNQSEERYVRQGVYEVHGPRNA
jgi:hypothetical protein